MFQEPYILAWIFPPSHPLAEVAAEIQDILLTLRIRFCLSVEKSIGELFMVSNKWAVVLCLRVDSYDFDLKLLRLHRVCLFNPKGALLTFDQLRNWILCACASADYFPCFKVFERAFHLRKSKYSKISIFCPRFSLQCRRILGGRKLLVYVRTVVFWLAPIQKLALKYFFSRGWSKSKKKKNRCHTIKKDGK